MTLDLRVKGSRPKVELIENSRLHIWKILSINSKLLPEAKVYLLTPKYTHNTNCICLQIMKNDSIRRIKIIGEQTSTTDRARLNITQQHFTNQGGGEGSQ